MPEFKMPEFKPNEFKMSEYKTPEFKIPKFKTPEFKTIRQTAATGIITEHYLRLMVARGDCPGIRSGNRFLVNVPALAEMLDKLSRNKREGVEDARN